MPKLSQQKLTSAAPAKRSLIDQPNFENNGKKPDYLPDRPTQMRLTIDQVHLYDRNPRRTENSRYTEIKESIRETGSLKTILNVTQRPGQSHYIIEAGGNTRLQILKELYQETSDERFYQLDCQFVPWSSEQQVLANHLIENEMRGEMTFIDKALAIYDFKTMLEQESGVRITQAALIAELKSAGFTGVSQSHLSKMFFAVEVLHECIPTLLQLGMGKPQIEEINKRLNVTVQFVEGKQLGDKQIATSLFKEVLATLDAADPNDWSIVKLNRALATRFADITGDSENYIAHQIDALLDFQRGSYTDNAAIQRILDNDPATAPNTPATAISAAPSALTPSIMTPEPQPRSMTESVNTISPIDSKTASATESQKTVTNRADYSQPQISTSFVPPSTPSDITNCNTIENDLDRLKILRRLRIRNYVLVTNLTVELGIEDTLHPEHIAYGFSMDYHSLLNRTALGTQLWIYLIMLNEQISAPIERVTKLLGYNNGRATPIEGTTGLAINDLRIEHSAPASGQLPGCLTKFEENLADNLNASPFQLGQLFQALSAEMFEYLLELTGNCKIIHQDFSIEDVWDASNLDIQKHC